MTIPDAAIEAAAKAIYGESRIGGGSIEAIARAAIDAAMPVIREALAQEAIDSIGDSAWRENAMWRGGVGHAARVIQHPNGLWEGA